MYVEFAHVAREEGFTAIANLFENVAIVERGHEERYLKLLARVEAGEVFSDPDATTQWQCRYCGYIHTGKNAPKTCPTCGKPQAYFQRRQENY